MCGEELEEERNKKWRGEEKGWVQGRRKKKDEEGRKNREKMVGGRNKKKKKKGGGVGREVLGLGSVKKKEGMWRRNKEVRKREKRLI